MSKLQPYDVSLRGFEIAIPNIVEPTNKIDESTIICNWCDTLFQEAMGIRALTVDTCPSCRRGQYLGWADEYTPEKLKSAKWYNERVNNALPQY